VVAAQDGLLGDNVLANNLRQQATKMEMEAKGLLAESQRLLKEAAEIDPIKATAKKKAAPKKAKVTA
jgi:hypothetical protein